MSLVFRQIDRPRRCAGRALRYAGRSTPVLTNWLMTTDIGITSGEPYSKNTCVNQAWDLVTNGVRLSIPPTSSGRVARAANARHGQVQRGSFAQNVLDRQTGAAHLP